MLVHNGTQTSRAAATSTVVVEKSVRDRRMLVTFLALEGPHGGTDQEIAAACPDIHPDAVRARRGEAYARGFITKELGEKRATTSNNMAQVWHITKLGMDACGLGGWAV